MKAENKLSNDDKNNALKAIEKLDSVLDFLSKDSDDLEAEIDEMIRLRNKARNNKDFAESDRIRDELLEKGIILEDSPTGTKWKRKI